MAPDRLRVSLKRTPAMSVHRIAIEDAKLVYVICANRMIKYPHGKSPIAYIGTTKNGIDRVAQSAAYRANDILWRHGITSFDVRIVTCGVRRRVRTWRKLERALLLTFKERFGIVPICNTAGKNIAPSNEFKLFAKSRIAEVINGLTKSGEAVGAEISN